MAMSFVPVSVSAKVSRGPTVIDSPNVQGNGMFGTSVAAGDNHIVIGAPGESGGSGQAYIYNTDRGKFTTLTSPNPQGGQFGYSVATNGKIVVVGEPFDTVGSLSGVGQAYVYNIETSKYTLLTDPSPSANALFGWSVAAGDDIVVVGAPDTSLSTPGSVFIFNAKTGALVTTLSSPNAVVGGQFGYSVAADGNTVVVGAPTETAGGYEYDGHAYIYNSDSQKYTTLTNPNAQTNCDPSAQNLGDFGFSVAASNSRVVVGAITNAVSGNCSAGNAYSFNAHNGKLMRTLTSPNAEAGGYFGVSVALSDSRVVVGAIGEQNFAGNAYSFNPDSGKLMNALTSPNSLAGGSFGFSVAMIDNAAVVGAFSETAGGNSGAGNVYLFDGNES
jgi:FG-GAP repeat protein